MKRLIKVFVLLTAVLALSSCAGGISYRMKVKKGDIRTTESDEYVLTEVCTGTNGFGYPLWKKVSIQNKNMSIDYD